MRADELDVDGFVARLAEEIVNGAERRAAATARRDRANKAADESARAALASDAPPALKTAKLAAARSRKNLAAAEFAAAVTEGFGPPTIAPPQGRAALHYDSGGRLVATTEWRGGELVTKTAAGVIVGRTAFK